MISPMKGPEPVKPVNIADLWGALQRKFGGCECSPHIWACLRLVFFIYFFLDHTSDTTYYYYLLRIGIMSLYHK